MGIKNLKPPSPRRNPQSLAADGAVACFSSNFFPLSLNADRAPQLKAVVYRCALSDDYENRN